MSESQDVSFRDLDTCYQTTIPVIAEATHLTKSLLGTEFYYLKNKQTNKKDSAYLRGKNIEWVFWHQRPWGQDERKEYEYHLQNEESDIRVLAYLCYV